MPLQSTGENRFTDFSQLAGKTTHCWESIDRTHILTKHYRDFNTLQCNLEGVPAGWFGFPSGVASVAYIAGFAHTPAERREGLRLFVVPPLGGKTRVLKPPKGERRS